MGGDDVYPPGPSQVPPELTRPTGAYRRHAYLAVAGLFAFVALYFALAGWFAWTAYRLLSSIPRAPDRWLVLGVGGAAAAFLAVFMFKAVIFVRRGKLDDGVVELTRAEHPRLFAFLDRLADEARAPRAHRVFLSPQVNASVFYNLSIANLILPAKKNLEIGLGLVNVLTIGEVKAVLAHEFGHFAQRTMAVGRWVYMAQQIAGHIVVKRDALDRALQVLSSIDLRIAWVGWILRGIVWSIRSLVDSAFRWVVLAQRALSREMELQADLVAVSLTGSDALVHALHRLEAADDAMDRAFSFTASQARKHKHVEDVFAIQSEMLERKRAIIDDPMYGLVPALPAQPAAHRLFEARIAHPPKMWSSHPPNEVREANAKRVYVEAPLDDRSGWVLFDDPPAIRRTVTGALHDVLGRRLAEDGPMDPADAAQPPAVLSLEASKALLDDAFDRSFLAPDYRGCYLGRSVVRAAPAVDALYGAEPPPEQLIAALDALYPETLGDDLERVETLGEEKAMLAAIQRGILEAPGGIIRHRGVEHRRRELPALVAQLEAELAAATRVVEDHDRRVRAVHLACARTQSQAWVDYLRGLAAALHYADHRKADLEDAFGSLQNVLSIVTADQKVTSGELDRLVSEAMDLHGVLEAIFDEAGQVSLGRALQTSMELEVPWQEALGTFELGLPHRDNMSDWLGVAGSWIGAAESALSMLGSHALDELLLAERAVATAVRTGEPAREAPEPPRVPPRYRTLLPGHERPRQTKLGWWDRFQVADGIVPAFARFAIAGAIVAGVLFAARSVGGAKLTIVNALSRPVVVSLDGTEHTLAGNTMRTLDVSPGSYTVRTTAGGALVEELAESVGDDFGHYVYNVAQAASLVEWNARFDKRTPIGAPRWSSTSMESVFLMSEVRPQYVNDNHILVALAGVHPQVMLDGAPEPEAVVAAHVRWEPPGTRYLASWLELAAARPDGKQVLAARLAAYPSDVATLGFEQVLDPTACERHRAQAAKQPDDPGWAYLAARCLEPRAATAAFDELHARFPRDGRISYIAACRAVDRGDYEAASQLLEQARLAVPDDVEDLTLALVKVRRLQGYEGFADAYLQDAPVLASVRLVEGASVPADTGPEVLAIRALQRGLVDEALATIKGSAFEPTLVALAACSDRAPAAVVERARAAAVEDLAPYGAACAAGLAIRAGRDFTPYLAKFGPYSGARMRAFAAWLATGEGDGAALLDGVDPDVRGYASLMVIGARGANTPAEWRKQARALLFPYERPYLEKEP